MLAGSVEPSLREERSEGWRGAMLVRVVTIQVKPEKMEECIASFKEVTVPFIAVRPRFDHGHW
jgi:hypothetical protein